MERMVRKGEARKKRMERIRGSQKKKTKKTMREDVSGGIINLVVQGMDEEKRIVYSQAKDRESFIEAAKEIQEEFSFVAFHFNECCKPYPGGNWQCLATLRINPQIEEEK